MTRGCQEARAEKGCPGLFGMAPDPASEDLQAYVAAGVRHFVLDFSVPTPPQMIEAMERFAQDVRPRVDDA